MADSFENIERNEGLGGPKLVVEQFTQGSDLLTVVFSGICFPTGTGEYWKVDADHPLPVANFPFSGSGSKAIDGYAINDIEEGTPNYYGFEDASGAWYILKEDTSAGTYRYAKGASGYATAWTNRASQTYAIYGTTF